MMRLILAGILTFRPASSTTSRVPPFASEADCEVGLEQEPATTTAQASSKAVAICFSSEFEELCKSKSPADPGPSRIAKRKQAAGLQKMGPVRPERLFREAFKSCKASGQVSWLEELLNCFSPLITVARPRGILTRFPILPFWGTQMLSNTKNSR
jgi:hypothetical protein